MESCSRIAGELLQETLESWSFGDLLKTLKSFSQENWQASARSVREFLPEKEYLLNLWLRISSRSLEELLQEALKKFSQKSQRSSRKSIWELLLEALKSFMEPLESSSMKRYRTSSKSDLITSQLSIGDLLLKELKSFVQKWWIVFSTGIGELLSDTFENFSYRQSWAFYQNDVEASRYLLVEVLTIFLRTRSWRFYPKIWNSFRKFL